MIHILKVLTLLENTEKKIGPAKTLRKFSVTYHDTGAMLFDFITSERKETI